MVNIDPQQRSSRYVTNSDGAPPVPPAGGYRGAARPRGSDQTRTSGPGVRVEIPGAPVLKRSVFGWVALAVSAVFAAVLLLFLALGKVDVLFSLTLAALQFVVLGVIIAALLQRNARKLGAIALSIGLVFNVATIGALSSSSTAINGAYEGHKSEEDKLWQSYPGIKDIAPITILNQPSLETVRDRSNTVLAEIRAELTSQLGYTWAPAIPEDISPVRNGYGGESMLVAYTSEQWMSEQPITSSSEKRNAMAVIDTVLDRHGMSSIYSLNDPDSGLDPTVLEKMFGSADVNSQPQWEWYSYNYDGASRMYADLYDLSKDADGSFTKARNAAKKRTGEPLEGIKLTFFSDQLLSDADRDAFQTKLKDYP